MKTGYYIIKLNGKLLPARWDGKAWYHENGTTQFGEIVAHNRWQRFRKWLGLRVQPLSFSCPTGCSCTQNPDGSWNVHCTRN